MVITYPLLTVVDDSGAVVAGATVAVTSVKDKAGADIATPGLTVNQSGANVSADYDAEARGEAWVVLAVSKAGSTFTGLNAAPAFYLSRDPSRIESGVSATGGVSVAVWGTTPVASLPNYAQFLPTGSVVGTPTTDSAVVDFAPLQPTNLGDYAGNVADFVLADGTVVGGTIASATAVAGQPTRLTLAFSPALSVAPGSGNAALVKAVP